MTIRIVDAGDGDDFAIQPWVTARAVLPLPPRSYGGDNAELELLHVSGPPEVVGAAVDRLAQYVAAEMPEILAYYRSRVGGVSSPTPWRRR